MQNLCKKKEKKTHTHTHKDNTNWHERAAFIRGTIIVGKKNKQKTNGKKQTKTSILLNLIPGVKLSSAIGVQS